MNFPNGVFVTFISVNKYLEEVGEEEFILAHTLRGEEEMVLRQCCWELLVVAGHKQEAESLVHNGMAVIL